MSHDILQRQKHQSEPHQGFEAGQPRCVYQPVVDLRTGRTAGVEALAHRHDPNLGWQGTGETVSVVGGPMSSHRRRGSAFRQASQQAVERGYVRSDTSFFISLKPAGRHSDGLGGMRRALPALAASGMDALGRYMEVASDGSLDPERPLFQASPDIRVFLTVDVSNAGRASLACLTDMPAIGVAIDPSIVRGIGLRPEESRIIESILERSRLAGVPVVAEGVETPLQLQLLQELGCPLAQGDLFASPVPGESLAPLLDALWFPTDQDAAPWYAAPDDTCAWRGRILIADDDELYQQVEAAVLRNAGFSVDVVSNGAQAVDALDRRPYDLVLMDCQMPEMDGYGATRKIRRFQSDRRHTPILAVTSLAGDEERRRCLAVGMDERLTKPVRECDLIGAVLRWTECGWTRRREVVVERFSALVTGVDYLDLLARRHADELARAINYSELAVPADAVQDEADAGGLHSDANPAEQVVR